MTSRGRVDDCTDRVEATEMGSSGMREEHGKRAVTGRSLSQLKKSTNGTLSCGLCLNRSAMSVHGGAM